MRLKCVECGKQYDIPDNKLDDYNIYWIMRNNKVNLCPQLLCPICTKFWSKKAKGA